MVNQSSSKNAGRPLLHVDLKDLKEPWLDWCRARNLTPSEAVRRIVKAVLDGNPTDGGLPHPDDFNGVAGEDRRRVEIRIPATEFLALEAAAGREGMSVPRWLIGLVRTSLTGEALLVEHEAEALARSNTLLLALGRNINQIAYNMNQRVDRDELTQAQVEYVSKFLKEHVGEVSSVLQASRKRWRR